jgi:hypothetical protein
MREKLVSKFAAHMRVVPLRRGFRRGARRDRRRAGEGDEGARRDSVAALRDRGGAGAGAHGGIGRERRAGRVGTFHVILWSKHQMMTA